MERPLSLTSLSVQPVQGRPPLPSSPPHPPPSSEGWRGEITPPPTPTASFPAQLNLKGKLRALLGSPTNKGADSSDAHPMVWIDCLEPRPIDLSLAHTLLLQDDEGRPIDKTNPGNHLTGPIDHGLFVKVGDGRHPLRPAYELAASLFGQLIGGGHTIVTPTAFATVSIGTTTTSLQLTNALTSEDPDHPRYLLLKAFLPLLSQWQILLNYNNRPAIKPHWKEWASLPEEVSTASEIASRWASLIFSQELNDRPIEFQPLQMFDRVSQSDAIASFQRLYKNVSLPQQERGLEIVRQVMTVNPMFMRGKRLIDLLDLALIPPAIAKLFPHQSLDDQYQRMKEIRGKCDQEAFAALVVWSILTKPSDGKSDNYMVEIEWTGDQIDKWRIVAIDSDRAFRSSLHIGKHKTQPTAYPHHRSILYAFTQATGNQMSLPLPQSLLERLSRPEALLIEWITALDNSLATYTTDDSFELPSDFLVDLYHSLLELKRDPPSSLMEVLKRLDPLTHLYFTETQGEEGLPSEVLRVLWDGEYPLARILEGLEYRMLSWPTGQTKRVEEILLQTEKQELVPLATALATLTEQIEWDSLSGREKLILYRKLAALSFPVSIPKPNELLHLAIENLDLRMVELALNSGANTDDSLNLLIDCHRAAPSSALTIARALIPHLSVDGSSERPPIFYALEHCPDDSSFFPGFVELLALNEGDLDMEHRQHRTPLDYAMELNKPRLFEILLSHGAGVNVDAKKACRFVSDHSIDHLLDHLGSISPSVRWEETMRCLSGDGELSVHGITRGAMTLQRDLNLAKDPTDERLTGELAPSGSHRVFRVRINNGKVEVYFKEKPDMAGFEYAVGLFHQMVVGHGTPSSELFRFEACMDHGYPVLASQAVGGDNFSEAFRNNDPRIAHLNLHRLHNLTLAAMLLNPEDGKANNFQLVPFGEDEYEFVSFDNDHAFYHPFRMERGRRVLQVKSLLFLLDQMKQPVDSKTRHRFLAIEPRAFLTKWLTKLQQWHEGSLSLFSAKERKELQKDPKEVSVVTIPFPPGFGAKMWEKLTWMQEALKDPEVTPLQLLCRLMPALGRLYEHELNQEKTPYQRWSTLCGPYYKTKKGKEITLSNAMTVATDLKLPEAALVGPSPAVRSQGNILYTPEAVLQELSIMEQQASTIHEVIDDLETGSAARFNDLLTDGLKENAWNRAIAKDPALFPTLVKAALADPVSFEELSVRNTDIKDEELVGLLKNSPFLVRLDLRGCNSLTPKSLVAINKVTSLQYLSIPPWARLSSITLPNLEMLVAENGAFSSLTVASSCLKTLRLGGCSRIGSLSLKTDVLEEIDLERCTSLSNNVFSQLRPSSGTLSKMIIEGSGLNLSEAEDKIVRESPRLLPLVIHRIAIIEQLLPLFNLPAANTFTLDRQDLSEGMNLFQLTNSFGQQLAKVLLLLPAVTTVRVLRCQGEQVAGLFYYLRKKKELSALEFEDNDHIQGALLTRYLKKMPQVTSLNFGHHALDRIYGVTSVFHSIKEMGRLTMLSLRDGCVHTSNVELFGSSLKAMTRLTTLNLEGNNLGEHWVVLAPALKEIKGIISLNLAGNRLWEDKVEVLAPALKEMKRLTMLNLSKNGLRRMGVEALAPAFKEMRALTSLSLADCGLLIPGAAALAPILKGMTGLTTLDLSYNSIGGKGASALFPALRQMKQLTTLNLQSNYLRRLGAEALAPTLKDMTGLITLDVRYNKLDTDQKKLITDHSNLTTTIIWD